MARIQRRSSAQAAPVAPVAPAAVLVAVLLLAPAASWADEITFVHLGQVITVAGNVLAQDSQQTLLFEGRDLQHYIIAASERQNWRRDPAVVKPFTARELRTSLQNEFGPTFKIIQSNNYMIVYNCSESYANDAKKLFEKVDSVFRNYFLQLDFKLTRPDQPRVAVIFASATDYARYMLPLIGPLASETAGVYIPRTNRMYMFDAVGGWNDVLALLAQRNPPQAGAARLQLVKQNIATIVHEAVHQIAYNSGFHDRHVQNPLWLVEGMAMIFESPRLESKSGWSGPEYINPERVSRLLEHPAGRGPERLERMVTDDSLFQTRDTALDMYAEAWAFSYYLIKRHSKGYAKYIGLVNAYSPMADYPADKRLEHFRTAFAAAPGELWDDYDRFLRKSVLSKSP